MDKPIQQSKTIQGGAVAALSGLAYAWADVLGWADSMTIAVVATIGTLGVLWSLYGLRHACSAKKAAPDA